MLSLPCSTSIFLVSVPITLPKITSDVWLLDTTGYALLPDALESCRLRPEQHPIFHGEICGSQRSRDNGFRGVDGGILRRRDDNHCWFSARNLAGNCVHRISYRYCGCVLLETALPTLFLLEVDMAIPEGGKTGITAVVIGLMFLNSVFFAPIFASIPSWATGGALVIVGSLMIRKWVVVSTSPLSTENISMACSLAFHLVFASVSVRDINWDYIGDAVPAFLTIIVTPLSYKLSPCTLDWLIRDG